MRTYILILITFLSFSLSSQNIVLLRSQSFKSSAAFDADADAFITASGITDDTQKNAINDLVVDLKAAGIWSKMAVIYPFIGGTASTHKYNLKDPRDLDAAYRITFTGTITHNSSGVQGANSNSGTMQADTMLDTDELFLDNHSMFYFSNTERNSPNGQYNIGAGGFYFVSEWTNTDENIYIESGGAASVSTSNGTTVGLWGFSRVSSTEIKSYHNGTLFDTYASNSVSLGAADIGILGTNSTSGNSDDRFTFACIGQALTDTEASDLNNAIVTYNQALNRHPYDTDADAFITASGITDEIQVAAIQNLVIDLKAAGVWSKMSAIYPIIGGTASSHKWNLKDPRDLDAAYRLTFGSGVTHAATGIKGDNSSNGYAETYLIPSTGLALNSASLWYYSTEDIAGTGDIDAGVNTNSTDDFILAMDYDGANGYSSLNNTQTNNYHLAGSTAAFMGSSRISSTEFKLYVNGSTASTVTATSVAIEDTYSILLLAAKNTAGGVSAPSPRECAFAAIGDGLTDTEAADFYTAVTTYQTTLTRQN